MPENNPTTCAVCELRQLQGQDLPHGSAEFAAHPGGVGCCNNCGYEMQERAPQKHLCNNCGEIFDCEAWDVDDWLSAIAAHNAAPLLRQAVKALREVKHCHSMLEAFRKLDAAEIEALNSSIHRLDRGYDDKSSELASTQAELAASRAEVERLREVMTECLPYVDQRGKVYSALMAALFNEGLKLETEGGDE